jgi:hypothetical protein
MKTMLFLKRSLPSVTIVTVIGLVALVIAALI